MYISMQDGLNRLSSENIIMGLCRFLQKISFKESIKTYKFAEQTL